MIIKEGKILIDGRIFEGDIKIENGIISKIDRFIGENGEEIIYANGRYVLPGLIDIHTHLDDTIGKYNIADNFNSGSLIAAKNGITTLFNFITERGDRPLNVAIKEFLRKGKDSSVNYGFHLTPINFGKKEIDYIKGLIDTGFKSFKFYTTYKDAGIYIDYEKMHNVVSALKSEDTIFLVHAEDESILEKYYCYDYQTPFDHALYRPVEAEVEAVKKVIQIAKETDANFHIVHCSAVESANLINASKKECKITVESCPQYLVLNDELLKENDGHRYFCTPPLRSSENSIEMQRLAREGKFDIFTTDHAPFIRRDKDENRERLRLVPNGLPGIGALAHIIYRIYTDDNKVNLSEFAKRLSENPARIMNLFPQKGAIKEGSDADIIIFSECKEKKEISPTDRDVYNPYYNFTSNLRFDYVIINGVLLIENGRVINNNFRGRCINVNPEGIQE
ncbi:MAG: amidohydrolase family protein [Myxococcota bacterium]